MPIKRIRRDEDIPLASREDIETFRDTVCRLAREGDHIEGRITTLLSLMRRDEWEFIARRQMLSGDADIEAIEIFHLIRQAKRLLSELRATNRDLQNCISRLDIFDFSAL
jgi:hypothetical protein